MDFFLGTHAPGWLKDTRAWLFVSDRRLRSRRQLPRALGNWSLDSGGFTELQQYGSWDHGPSPHEYADRVRRYRDEIGGLLWASPQDWMCEPIVISGGTAGGGVTFAGTGLSVAEHQRRTVANYLLLRDIAPDLPFIPVLQGYRLEEYLTCIDRYGDAGVDLAGEPIVGIGSVCRRQATTEAAEIIAAVRDRVPGIRLHGFGIKTSGLASYGSMLASADSMAWSYSARKRPPLPGHTHITCANCRVWAFRWREKVLASLARHATRTPPAAHRKGAAVSRKLDAPPALAPVPAPAQGGARVSRKLDTQPAAEAPLRLALAAFRDDAARLERDATIRWAHHTAGLSIRAIAARLGLSPARVGQITAQPDQPLIETLRALRARWGVDADPATAAAADHIIATLIDTAPGTAAA
ncbi:hypothetical protein ACFVVL_22125 [Kitasatospora sp. NPDC058115]|uniref:deazapurine DNA modification protein DpdA family protein n=1 Tax=Kitasatospora sp. NPDC058115 TaxID=3346347 RepID=UPI0036D9D0E5